MPTPFAQKEKDLYSPSPSRTASQKKSPDYRERIGVVSGLRLQLDYRERIGVGLTHCYGSVPAYSS